MTKDDIDEITRLAKRRGLDGVYEYASVEVRQTVIDVRIPADVMAELAACDPADVERQLELAQTIRELPTQPGLLAGCLISGEAPTFEIEAVGATFRDKTRVNGFDRPSRAALTAMNALGLDHWEPWHFSQPNFQPRLGEAIARVWFRRVR